MKIILLLFLLLLPGNVKTLNYDDINVDITC